MARSLHLLVSSEEILFEARRRLVGNFEAALKQNGGEVAVLLTREEQFEIGVFLFDGSELFLERVQPSSDQMHVLETHPLPLFCRRAHHGQSCLVLAASHRKLKVVLPPHLALTVLLQLLRRIVARRHDEQRRNVRRGLFFSHLLYGRVVATDVCDSQRFACEIYECDLQFLRPEHHNYQQPLETGQFCTAGRKPLLRLL